MKSAETLDSDDLAVRVGRKVRTLRDLRGLSRREVVEAAGISERYLIQLEAAESNVSLLVLSRIATALGVELTDLLMDDGATAFARPTDPSMDESLGALIGNMSRAEQKGCVPALQAWLNERRRSQRGVALLGLRGAGKSTLGRLLAARHNVPFVSVTREIERRTGIGLDDLFNLGGPDAYRAMENEAINALLNRDDFIVVETAGGIVANKEAMATIISSFRTIWLKASPETHLQRVINQGDMRPFQAEPRALEHVRKLLLSREDEYSRAEFAVDTTDLTPEACLNEIDRIMDLPATLTQT
ncbi:XRE family aerobic/anaerobic benzoate catabolism transcriptional regulator [Beijerinckia sp. GAS462]|nr:MULTISPECIES: shikimate kinase [unclassified Beijerinckia]MDH7798627.1 XRE family aerobic/anaerobic benzoate catabolism transcriptional regulator [Beijerinckia sp. GAS462]SED27195.1 transcriptional regulator, XRE family with shikimate kinase activity [Beijerinckia sp. 28-YEA-48]